MKHSLNDTIPLILYKYRDWDNQLHRTIITDRIIWLPSCTNLDDPYDCKTPIYVRNVTEEKKKHITELIHKRISIDFPSLSMSERKKMEIEVFKEKNFMNYPLQKKLQSETIDKRFGIFSLSSNPLIPQMWSEYANHNKGFCIGFDINVISKLEHLKLELGKIATLFSLNEVDYVDEFPKWEDITDEILIDQLTTKLVKYKFEEEYRLIVTNKPNETYKVPKYAIKEIIFGLESSKNAREEIMEEIQKNKINVKFYEIVQIENNSELSRRAIE